MTPPLSPLVTIPTLARMAGVRYRTMLRRIMRLHAQDVRDREPTDWIVKRDRGEPWRVNLKRLRKRHPALFDTRYVDRTEYDELVERVDLTENRLDGYGARIRKVEGVLRVGGAVDE